MVDKQQFHETYSYFDKEVIIEIIEIYTSEYAARFEKLLQYAREANFKDLRFEAHSVKGVIANFCAKVAWDEARDLENAANSFIASNGQGYDENEMIKRISLLKEHAEVIAVQLNEIRDELMK